MSARSGQCLCGAIKYHAANVESEYGACHCKMCQRWVGGPIFAATAKDVTFDGEENLVRYQSSDWAERGFCRRCGSNLFYRMVSSEDYEMCVGTFDETDDLALRSEIFIDGKMRGIELAGDHPRLTEAETLERYKEFSEE